MGAFVRRMSRAVVAGVLATLLVSCGSGGNDPPAPVAEASATIDATGGTVSGPDGIVVKIPAGALTEPTVIRIARTATGSPAAPPDDHTIGEKVYEITPHDLVFLYPATIEMPWTPGTTQQLPFKASPLDVWLPVDATIDGGTASWLTNSFSWFMVGVCAPRTDDPYSCVAPSVRTSVVSSVAGAITQRHSGPESIAWTVTKATTLDITLAYSAAADCGDAKLAVTRRANGGRVAATLIDTAVSLSTDPENAKRRSGSRLWQLTTSEADNGLSAYDVRFSCQRPGRNHRASAGGMLMFYGDSIAPQPAEAPAFVSQPQDVTVTVGSTATFSVTASGVPAPALQWQVSSDAGGNWTNISGATTASHTTPATSSDDSGKRFRVVATNASGSANSNAAMLTVNASTATTWSAVSTLADNWIQEESIDVGTDRDGDGFAVWVGMEATGKRNVYASARPTGGSWSMPTVVHADSLADAAETRLAVSANGSAVAIWRSLGATETQLMGARNSSGGWASATRIDQGTGTVIGGQRVAIDGAGRAAAVWWQTWDYVVRLSVDSLSGWSAPIDIATAGILPDPAVAVDSQGHGFAAWRDATGVWVRAIDLGAANPVVGASVQLATVPGSSRLRMTMSPNGHALLTWLESGGATLRAARFVPGASAGTGSWSSPETAAAGVKLQMSQSVAVDDSGNGFIVWREDGASYPRPIVASVHYGTSSGWSAVTQLSEPNSSAWWSDVAMNAAGRGAVIWGVESPTWKHEVWTRVYENGAWGSPTRVQQPKDQFSVDDAGAISVADNTTQDIAAAWFASATSNWGVFAVTSP